MANCYICPDCGVHLDWNEAYSHQCEPPEQEAPKEKTVDKVYDRNDPDMIAAREEALRRIYNMRQKN